MKTRTSLAPSTSSTESTIAESPGDLITEFDRLQHQLRSHLERWHELDLPNALSAAGEFTPAADIEEFDDAYLVEIELAGVNRSDVDIDVTERRLTVTGERKEKERVGVLRRKHRTVGQFRFDIELPAEFDADNVTAGLEDGVLSVRLPKTAAAQARRVSIN